MKSKLFWFGSIASAAYIGIMFWFFGWRFHRLLGHDLNEVGDFLAGAFSPLAFLWLVLGFMQQGQELSISSKALLKQAEELQNSVQQQKVMADAAVAQIQAQADALAFQANIRDQEMRATLEFRAGTVTGANGGGIVANFQVFNYGGDAAHVALQLEPPLGGKSEIVVGDVMRDSSKPVSFFYPRVEGNDQTGVIIADYLGRDGKSRRSLFSYSVGAKRQNMNIERRRDT